MLINYYKISHSLKDVQMDFRSSDCQYFWCFVQSGIPGILYFVEAAGKELVRILLRLKISMFGLHKHLFKLLEFLAFMNGFHVDSHELVHFGSVDVVSDLFQVAQEIIHDLFKLMPDFADSIIVFFGPLLITLLNQLLHYLSVWQKLEPHVHGHQGKSNRKIYHKDYHSQFESTELFIIKIEYIIP